MKKLKRYLSQNLIQENLIPDLFLSYTVSFLTIICFSLYRQIVGINFIEIRSAITDNYLRFLLLFLFLGLFLFLFFCVFLKRSDLLDIFLIYGGVISSILIAGFSSKSFSICIILYLIMGILAYYFFIYRSRNLLVIKRRSGLILGVITFCYVVFVAILCVLKHRIFLSYDMDLGIFDQVFFSFTKTLKAMFTLYGDEINHMVDIHFSPILYLLLPGYKLFQSAEYLIIIQVIFIGLAIFPLYKLCLVYKLEEKAILFICISFLLQPGILGGLFYDFHEYALLPFLIFWLLYFLETRKTWGIIVFLLLILMTKEDLVIYVSAIGLFELLRRNGSKKIAFGLILFSIVYFLFISNFVLDTTFFHNRYSGLINSETDASYFDVIKVFFTNPLYLFSQCFSNEKLVFIGMVFLPLSLIPLVGLFHISEIFLFLPMIVINLLSSWQPQYSINYQYNFGTIPLFIFICIRFLSSIKDIRIKNMMVTLMLISAIIFSGSFHIDKLSYVTTYKEKQPEIQAISQSIKKIPEIASVTAASHFFPTFITT